MQEKTVKSLQCEVNSLLMCQSGLSCWCRAIDNLLPLRFLFPRDGPSRAIDHHQSLQEDSFLPDRDHTHSQRRLEAYFHSYNVHIFTKKLTKLVCCIYINGFPTLEKSPQMRILINTGELFSFNRNYIPLVSFQFSV